MFSMRVVSDFIPDRSRPGITTTVTSDWAPRATGGHATWMQRRDGKQWKRKERNEERKKAKKIKLKVATLNVGTMTSKGRKVADLMERRRMDILCVQETRWKGEKARCIGGGYKMWYCGSENKKNGVGIILKKEHVDRVVELWRVTDRITCLKKYERIVVGADLNGHVKEGNNGDEECMGRHGLEKRNNEGQAVVDFAKRMELAITNTYFVKKPAHRVTYRIDGRSSQVNYITVRRRRIKEVVDTKVIVDESVAKQHRIVVSAVIIWTKWKKAPKPVKRIKWWKLKDLKVKNKFKTKEGENELFKIAKQKNRQSKDVQQVRVIKSKTGEILMEEEKVKQRWKEYFDDLLNQENPRERKEIRTEETKRDVKDISVEEVKTGLRNMKKGKARGPDDIPVDVWIALGNKGVEFLVNFLIDSYKERRCRMNGGGACLYLCTKAKETSKNVEITGE